MADPVGTAILSMELAASVRRLATLTGLPASRYRRARFGWLGDLLYFAGIVNTDELQELHWNINMWTDDEVMQWKQSKLNILGAIAVASAIFASIGLTALQLPGMFDVNWSARALCAVSMILGILSIATATSQYQQIAKLNDALSIRLWLSHGRPKPSTIFRNLLPFVEKVHPSTGQHVSPSEKYDHPFNTLPLESSLSSLGEVSLPGHLLSLAVLLYIVGFCLYFLFLWVEDIGEIPKSHRNSFILILLVIGVILFYTLVLGNYTKAAEQAVSREFSLSSGAGSADRTNAIKKLKSDILACQDALSYMRGVVDTRTPGSEPEQDGEKIPTTTTAAKNRVAYSSSSDIASKRSSIALPNHKLSGIRVRPAASSSDSAIEPMQAEINHNVRSAV